MPDIRLSFDQVAFHPENLSLLARLTDRKEFPPYSFTPQAAAIVCHDIMHGVREGLGANPGPEDRMDAWSFAAQRVEGVCQFARLSKAPAEVMAFLEQVEQSFRALADLAAPEAYAAERAAFFEEFSHAN